MTNTTNLIDNDTLARMRAMLAALPRKQKTRFSKREVVAELAAEILNASEELGYSVEDLARLLGEHGAEMKPATLRGYLRQLANSASAKKSKRRSKASAVVNVATPDASDG